jgi:amino acid adenylation domain-containing protein/thioester reductase-like protein
MTTLSNRSFESTFEFSTLVDLLRWRALHQPDRRAYTFLLDGEAEEVCLTYGELDRQARAIGAWLQSLGMAGEGALLLYNPGLRYIAAFFGCLYAGVVAIPAYPPRRRRTLPRLQAIVADAQAKVVLTTAPIKSAVERLIGQTSDLQALQWLTTDGPESGMENDWHSPGVTADTLAFLQYTSGSTGTPKGVMLSHGNLLYNQRMIQQAFEHTEQSIVVGWLPLYHDMGLIGNVFQPLYVGIPCILMSPIHFLQQPLRWLRAISSYKATTSGGPNFAYDLCVQKSTPEQRAMLNLSSWNLAFSGAEPVRAETLERFAACFEPCGFRREAFYPCYGLAEATLFVSGGKKATPPVVRTFQGGTLEQHRVIETSTENDDARTLVSCGQTLLDQKAVIVHPESLTKCPPDQVGEIWVAGPCVAQGYRNRPEETKHTFQAYLADTGEGPFLRTGDLGFLKDGELFITGRLKDLIIIRGRNLYPQDIELTVERCHPALRSGCGAAFAVEVAQAERLVVVQEVERHQSPDLDAVVDAIRRAVAEEHEVQVYAVVLIKTGSIPKTSSGKIQRHACRARFLAGSLEVVRERKMTAEPEMDMLDSANSLTREKLLAVDPPQRQLLLESYLQTRIARVLGFDDPSWLDPRQPLSSLGLDSLMAIELQNNLEASLGVTLPMASFLQDSSITEFSTQVLAQLPMLSSPPPAKPLSSVVPAPAQRHLPFPLNDLQQAYWAGRTGDFELGNVATHVYFEFESTGLDLERLSLAWQRLVDRHEMLRALVLSNGQQQILEQVPAYTIAVSDLRGQQRQVVVSQLEAVRQRMSHHVLPIDHWPLFEIRAHRLDHERIRLHLSIDLFIADARSLLLLLKEWSQLYQNPEAFLPPLTLSFRDYVLAEIALQDSESYRRSANYWGNRIPTLPPAPQLPLAKRPGSLLHPRFVRRSAQLSKETWRRLRTRAAQAGLTPSGVLLAAYAEVLAVWSRSLRFTINVTHFNRLPLHPQVNDIVGQFASFTLLQVNNAERDSFEARARRLTEQLWEALDHRHVGGVRVLRELSRAQGQRVGATMPVVFTSILGDLSEMDWLGEMIYGVSQTPQVWLDHQVFERHGALVLNWDAVEELFPEGLLEDMFGAYCRLLQRLADAEQAWQEMTRQLVPQAQLEQRVAINATEAPVPEKLLHTLFTAQVSQRPHQAAVVSSARTLTYLELYRRSNQVGRRLRQLGARPNTLVAVVMEKGWEQVVAVLGILQSGAAYLPIDPKLPKERLWYLLENGEVKLVLTQPWLNENLEWPLNVRRLGVDDEELVGIEDQPLEPVQEPQDLAFVIYTSGSTGLPKGVMITHRGLVNAIVCTNQHFDVGEEDRVLALTALHHDMSAYDVFGILAAGGTIVMPETWGQRDPAHWADLIARECVTIWNSVPAMMEMFVEHAASHLQGRQPRSLRLAFLGGDWIPVTLPDRLRALVEGVQVVSVGGPTETTLWNIWYVIETVDPAWKSIPYGRPIANTRYYVLNRALEHCPVWVEGELYCAGIGLAKGYWRDEEKTRARFIIHPQTGERLYRTGDLGRYLPDGNIEFLGREDFQVQINGHRVELGEIEAALNQHVAVRLAAVTVTGEPRGKKRLAAYVVPDAKRAPTSYELRSFLREKLPEHMVPSVFMFLDALPLNANGKVDRTVLPELTPAISESPREKKAEETALTTRIAQLVASVLKVETVHPEVDLTDLGANSVDMIRIANRLESELGFRPRMDEFFRLSTVAGLAEYYAQLRLERQMSFDQARQETERDIESLLASFNGLIDPKAREEFRKRQPGLRQEGEDRKAIQLTVPKLDDALKRKYTERRSHRSFVLRPIPFGAFSRFLSCLRQISLNGKPKYLYASGGGLYPVQTYLHVKAGRVEGISAGIYYYHPREHRLVELLADAHLDRNIHWPANRPIFDGAAFSIFLIAQLSAIAPMYGEESLRFATIEAGLISQLLETSAPAYHIGLCQIGSLDFKRIRSLFALEESHVLVHSLLGGLVDDTDPVGSELFEDPTVAGLTQGVPNIQADGKGLQSPEKQLGIGHSEGFSVAVDVTELNAKAVLPSDICPECCAPQLSTGSVAAGLQPAVRSVPCRNLDIHCETEHEGVPAEQEGEPSYLLLTGATGFLGAFLLYELLQQTEAYVYCLVRSPNATEGKRRLQRNLESYFLWHEDLSARIIPLPGDLTQPRFGLSSEQFQAMAGQIDVIYHSGAWVNWVQPYHALEATNVRGTVEVLRLASRIKLKPVHFVSTLAVFPFSGRARREQDSLDDNEYLYGGYAQSKWVAEKLVTIAHQRGLPVCRYRPAIVAGHSQTGVFNTDAYLENLIKGCIQLGSAPDVDTIVDMVPVDYVSKAIVHLSKQIESLGKVFHLTNPQPIHMSTLLDWIYSSGYPLRRVPYDIWKRELFNAECFQENALYPFWAFLANLGEQQAIMPQHDCQNTLNGLTGTSIVCPPVDDELLGTYFSHYVRSGFLHAPQR